MNVEELNSIAAGEVLSEDTARTIQRLAGKTQKLPALWKQVYHIAGRTHFLATSISAEWEDGAKIDYNAGDDIDFSKLHVYLHKDDEYTDEVEDQIEETSTYVPSITKVPEDAETGELSITINYGSGSELLSTTINITIAKPYVLPVNIDYYEEYGYTLNDYLDKYKGGKYIHVTLSNGSQIESSNSILLDDVLPSVSNDQEVSALIEFNSGSNAKEYEVPFIVHYHSIQSKEVGYDSAYIPDEYIELLSKGETEVSVNLLYSDDYFWFLRVDYDNGMSTAIHGGTFSFHESLPAGSYNREVTITFPGNLQGAATLHIRVYEHSDITLNGFFPNGDYRFNLGDKKLSATRNDNKFYLSCYEGSTYIKTDYMDMPPVDLSYAYGDSSGQRDAITNENILAGSLTKVNHFTDADILIRKNSDNTLYYTSPYDSRLRRIDNDDSPAVSSGDLDNIRAADDGSTYMIGDEEYTIIFSAIEGVVSLYMVYSISKEDYLAWAEENDITLELQ